MNEKKIIKLSNVSKKFKKSYVFKDLNLDISRGDCVHIVGDNGSGKSVTLKLLSGLSQPSHGNVDIHSNEQISYMPDKFPNSFNLSVKEYLNYLNKLNEYSYKKIEYYTKEFKMAEHYNFSIKNLSKGTLQKLNIIQALSSNANILILDEPFSGLDKNSQTTFYNILKKIVNSKTIIFSSHNNSISHDFSTHTFNIQTRKLSTSGSLISKSYKKITIPNKEQYYNLIHDCNYVKINHNVEKIDIYIYKEHSNQILKFLLQNDIYIKEIKDVVSFD